MDDCPWLEDRLPLSRRQQGYWELSSSVTPAIQNDGEQVMAVVESDQEGTTVSYEDQEVGVAVQGDEESHGHGEQGAAPSPPPPPPPPAPPPTPFEFKAATGPETIVLRPPHGHGPRSTRPQASSTAMSRCPGHFPPPPPPPPPPPALFAPPGPCREVVEKLMCRGFMSV